MGNNNSLNSYIRNTNRENNSEEAEDDLSDENLQEIYNEYLRRQLQPSRSGDQKQKKQKPYTMEEDEKNDNFMVFTNNLYEAKINKSIFKKQKTHYSDYNRKLKYSSSRRAFKQFQNNPPHLELPPSYNYHSKIMENMIPNKRQKIDQLRNSIYNIIFSQDGNQLLVTTQESLYTYYEEDGQYKRGKVLYPRNVTWTITDNDLSSSGRFLIHCSLNPFISIFDIKNEKYSNFYNLNDGEEDDDNYYHSLRFFSCKFSGDDTKIIASSGINSGSKAQIKLFDVGRERIQDSIQAHDDDINSIAFVDKQNSSVFISGSDDRSVKIWDTRALGSHGQSAGELLGHVAGITHVDSRQDYFYVASNSKDSSVKLWDLRKSVSSSVGKPRVNFSFDYRSGAMTESYIQKIRKLPQDKNFDNSVQTFRGHKVGKTLMRCHFSPLGPTDRRFIYTASYCGKVFLYDILSNTTSELSYEDEKNAYTAGVLNDMEQSTVRDAVWHPHKMEIITTNLKGHLFKWFNNDLFFEEIEDLEKEKQIIEDEERGAIQDSPLTTSTSQFQQYRWEEDLDEEYNEEEEEEEELEEEDEEEEEVEEEDRDNTKSKDEDKDSDYIDEESQSQSNTQNESSQQNN